MKLHKLAAWLLCAALIPGLWSCKDDDVLLSALGTPGGTVTVTATYNSLTFGWDAVKDAVWYGYELYDPSETLVVRDITKATEVTLTDLKPGTMYTLNVWAIPAVDGDYSDGEPLVLTGCTDDLITVDMPAVSVYDDVFTTYAWWDDVDGAWEYDWTLESDGQTLQSGTAYAENQNYDDDWNPLGTYYAQIGFNNLANGSYTLKVRSVTEDDGYASSDYAVYPFEVNRTMLWSAEGTYTSHLGTERTAVIEAWDNDCYRIKAFYGVEGYDLCFGHDPSYNPSTDDLAIWFTDTYNDYTYLYEIPTGLNNPATLNVDVWYGASNIEGDQNRGRAWFAVGENTGKTDTFRWGDAGPEAGVAAQLVGTYDDEEEAIDYYTYAGGEDVDDMVGTGTVTITAGDTPSEIKIKGLTYCNYTDASGKTARFPYAYNGTLTATVDDDALTVTIESGVNYSAKNNYQFVSIDPQTWAVSDTPVVGHLSRNSAGKWVITFGGGEGMAFGRATKSWAYPYLAVYSCVLTPVD